jgi:hypothetical protein
MSVRVKQIGAGLAITAAVIAGRVAGAANDPSIQENKPSQSRVAISQALPQLNGAQLEATVVEVTYETPTDVHQISANASQEKPARFLAYFVCDRKTPFSVPVPDTPDRKP